MVRTEDRTPSIVHVMTARQKGLLDSWLESIRSLPRPCAHEVMAEGQFREQTADVLRALTAAFSREQHEDTGRSELADSAAILRRIGAFRAEQGFTPTETAEFVLSLKDALLQHLQAEFNDNPELLNAEVIKMNRVMDRFALVTFETLVQACGSPPPAEFLAECGRAPQRDMQILQGSHGALSLDAILVDVATSLCSQTGYSIAELLTKRKYQYMTSEEYDEYEEKTLERFLGTENPPTPTLVTLLLEEGPQERMDEGNGPETDCG